MDLWDSKWVIKSKSDKPARVTSLLLLLLLNGLSLPKMEPVERSHEQTLSGPGCCC